MKLWFGALKLNHLSVRIANNDQFEYFQLKGLLFLYDLAEENEIELLQLYLLSFYNNLSENHSEKVFWPTKPDENLGFLGS